VLGALLLMKLRPAPRISRAQGAFDQLKAGIRYTVSHPTIRTLILAPGVCAFVGMAHVTLLPAWSVDILGGDATTNGLLLAARSIGAVLAAFMIASLGNYRHRGALLTVGTFVFPVLLLLFAVARLLPVALLLAVGIGWGTMIVFNMALTLAQSIVADEYRGRTMSIYTLMYWGGAPVSALWGGALAAQIGMPATVILSAVISLAFAVLLWLRAPALRKLA
jgi:predicted MFS family arabinose efflux permease